MKTSTSKTISINKLFTFTTGNLPALEKLDDGPIPLVYGTSTNNGVEKYVAVENEDDIFQPPLITVSYLGSAFVQVVPFTTSVVDKSNIIILVPIKEMSVEEMYFYSYQINRKAKFGFHYGRRLNMARLKKMELLPYENQIKQINFKKLLPEIKLYEIPKIQDEKASVPIANLFEIINAKSKGYDIYDNGDVAFVSNGTFNRGIVGYVTPYDDDRVFHEKSICVSAFCEATIQEPPFLPRGNGGSGLLVLKPKKEMSDAALHFYAAYINKFSKWRFHYGRMVTIARFEKLMLPNVEF